MTALTEKNEKCDFHEKVLLKKRLAVLLMNFISSARYEKLTVHISVMKIIP